MDIIDSKTDQELAQSILAEVAKARNELQCAQADIRKAQNRLSFLIVLANKLINRKGV
jgi:xanthine/CO dehydrogenase XdhC/CoxF family maturation factor